MRALRSTMYPPPGLADASPVTTVAREGDFRDTLESAAYQLLTPGAFVVNEIFECADDLQTAGNEAMARKQENQLQEDNQAMLYYWSVDACEKLHEGGVLFMDKPAPLSRLEIEAVFIQLAQHPDYKNFRIVSHTRDGEPVVLANGTVL